MSPAVWKVLNEPESRHAERTAARLECTFGHNRPNGKPRPKGRRNHIGSYYAALLRLDIPVRPGRPEPKK